MDRPAITVLVTGASAADAARVTLLLDAASPRFTVDHRPTLADAVERLRRGPVDVVLLDVGLSAGADAVTALRQAAEAPVVALADDAAAVGVLRAGAQDCVDAHADGGTLARALTHAIERHRAAAAERAMLERAWRARTTDRLRRLAGHVAHDFNNLLSIISGRAELVVAGLTADDPLIADLAIIQRTAERAAGIARRLVTFSRRRAPRGIALDVNHALAAMAPRLRLLAGGRVKVRLALAAEPAQAFVDPDRLEEAVVELVANARDAMPDGGGIVVSTDNLSVGAEAARPEAGLLPGAWIVVAVADGGSGMDPATRAHVAEPFGPVPRCGDGPALGLAIVAGLVQQAGGAVDVESEPGLGTTVRIVLPAAPGAGVPDRR